MKKIKLLFLSILGLFFIPTVAMASTKEPVNVHIFKSSSCPHCAEALEFFDALKEDSEYGAYFNLVPYETNGNTSEIQENISLATKVAKYFGNSFDGVPLIVIGDKYFEGYGSSMDNEIKNAIKKAYESEDRIDVVDGIQNGTLKKSNFDAIITIAIVIVLIVGIVYFVYLARKNPEEVLDESILEEQEIEEKEEKTEAVAESKKERSSSKTIKQNTEKKKSSSKSSKSKTTNRTKKR